MVNDRFNNPNSAIFLNAGYYLIPGGVYLSNDFTVTLWHYLKDLNHYRVFDIGDTVDGYNNIILMSARPPSAWLFTGVHSNIQALTTVVGPNNFILNKWEHLAFTLQGTYLKIYLNGVVIASEPAANVPKVMFRNYAYLGKSSATVDPNPIGYYDEMRFYDRALNETEILAVMRI